ncbi:hypothetical protein PI125_g9739 [Phytophthora idaei]|nr:hypothetical protein PI125_g9739 [Phytophthora idaei]
MQFTQDEALELLSLLASFGEESLWQALLQAGCFEVPERLLVPDVRFQLGTYCDVNAEQDFRFDVRGVHLLARLFALPAVIVTESNDRCHAEEATALLLYRSCGDLRCFSRLHFVRPRREGWRHTQANN